MPNPDDLLDTVPANEPQPNLRDRINAAEPQRQASADAVRSRIADAAARQQQPISVNAQGQAAAPGNLRDRIAVGADQAQADARAVGQRLGGSTFNPGEQLAAPEAPAQPAQPGLRERLMARANAAPSAADQALRQRMGGGIAQAAQQAAGPAPLLQGPATGSTFTPGASAAEATAAGAADAGAGGRAVVPVGRAAPGTVVPQGPGARMPVRPGAPSVIDITPSNASAPSGAPTPQPGRAVVPAGPGSTPPSSARGVVPAGPGATAPEAPAAPGKAPYTKPGSPPVRPGVSIVNGAGDATVPNPGLRDKLTVGANQAQADAKAVADRLAAGPKPATPRPDVGQLRQSVGLHPTPPGESTLGKYAAKVFGNAEEWKALGKRIAPMATKVGKVLGAGAIADGAYNAYEGVRQGDLGRAAWGVGDAIAGVASFTPAKPIAAAYLGARGAYELGHAAKEAFNAPKPAAPAAKPAAAAPAAAPAAKPAAPAAKPAAAQPAAAPAAAPAPQQPSMSAMAQAARDEALGAIDNEEAASPNAAYYQTVNHNTGTTTYETRDRGQITVQAPTEADKKLVGRVSVIDGRPDAGETFEQDGKVYRNVAVGNDEVGKPIIRAISVDGQPNTSTQVNDASLIRQYDEAQKRLAGPSAEDQARIGAYQDRQDRRDAIEQRYQQMLQTLQGGDEQPAPANTGVVADAARASAGGNANVAAFVQQYGEAAKAAGDKLGVDPNLLLTQWGHETGWGKSVIPGTNNLGNIKAVKGQGGVAATDNMTGSRDNYAQYASPHEFADQYVNLINTRYPGAVGAGSDMGKFATALKAGGYAEDPAYVNKLQAAYKTVQGAGGMQPQAPAAPNRFAPNPLAGGVQVIDMNSGNVNVTKPGMGSIYDGMSMDDYNTVRAAIQKNPQLADRLQMTERGAAVDGVPMPGNVIAGGDGLMAQYARNAAQAQRFAVNPTAGKLAEEAMRGEYANAGHQIQAGGTRYTADQHVEAARVAAAAGNKRYLEMKGGVNPKTFTPEPDMVFDTQSGQYVQRPGAGTAPQGQQQIPAAAIEMLRKQPQTAAQFDAQFGAGASKRYLQGN